MYTTRSDSSKQRFKFKIRFAHAKKENDGSIDCNQLSATQHGVPDDRRRQTREQEPFASNYAPGKEVRAAARRPLHYWQQAGRRRPAELFSSFSSLSPSKCLPELDLKAVSITL